MKVGDELGPSSWVEVTQGRIDRFADITEDHQRIHSGPGAIAHGFLTLSLVAAAVFELVPADGRRVINYGLNRVRFPAPVPEGSRVHTRLRVERIDAQDVTYVATVERDGGDKPVCVAELIFRYLDA